MFGSRFKQRRYSKSKFKHHQLPVAPFPGLKTLQAYQFSCIIIKNLNMFQTLECKTLDWLSSGLWDKMPSLEVLKIAHKSQEKKDHGNQISKSSCHLHWFNKIKVFLKKTNHLTISLWCLNHIMVNIISKVYFSATPRAEILEITAFHVGSVA